MPLRSKNAATFVAQRQKDSETPGKVFLEGQQYNMPAGAFNPMEARPVGRIFSDYESNYSSRSDRCFALIKYDFSVPNGNAHRDSDSHSNQHVTEG